MRKQLLYLTNHELTAFIWQGKELSRVGSFDNDAPGWQRFAAYLNSAQAAPTYLVADLIEEDFQRDTVPHVNGKARRVLLERRLAQLYRDTPYRHATLQGREKEGRKDDRYLFSALTNAELLKPWLEAMLKPAVPLVGIYSLASLSQTLFDRLKPDTGPALLVTHQPSGLRQSFFHEGQLRFSRLTPLFDHAADALAESFKLETAKTRQFLASTRLLARGDNMQIIVLANAANLAVLQDSVEDTPDMTHRLIDIGEGAAMLQLGQFDVDSDCSVLYLAMLARLRLASHYPLRDQKHFYPLLQARGLLYALAGAVALAAVTWAAIDVATIFDLRRQAAKLELEAVAAEYRYQTVVKNMPTTLVSPHNMRSVVDIERLIDRNVPLPMTQIAAISRALDVFPEIRIERLQWQALDTASLQGATDVTAPAPTIDVAPIAGALGLPDMTSQIVVLEGEVLPFTQDYRAAIGSVNRLAAELNRNRQLRAEVTQFPIDTRASVRLENSAGEERKELKAAFIMKLTWKP